MGLAQVVGDPTMCLNESAYSMGLSWIYASRNEQNSPGSERLSGGSS